MRDVVDLETQLQKDVMNIKKLAEEAGLDFFPVNFEIITKKAMVEFGTYALPNRYSHWTFGKQYGKLKNLSNLGVLEILEMVLNANPARAFLLDSNTLVEHRMVIAHVFAHVDFFKHNYWFSKTNRNMIAEAKFHERRIKELETEYGKKDVEEFLDLCIALQWHVDFYAVFKPKEKQVKKVSSACIRQFANIDEVDMEAGFEKGAGEMEEGKVVTGAAGAGPAAGDRDAAIGLSGQSILYDPAEDKGKEEEAGVAPPSGDMEDRDILKFLLREAPLTEWQKEIVQIVHDEIIYFIPTSLTKIMNEGWATYWHTEICQTYLDFEEFQQFAIRHSELMSSRGLNPYKLGFMMYGEIRKQWDDKFGEGAGLQKIYEIREFEDDVSFVRNYLTQKICDECGLFLFEQDKKTGEMVIKSTSVEDIKVSIINEIANFGKPLIVVRDGDYRDNEELYLEHKFDGRELDMNYAVDVMKALYRIWRRAVHLETILGEKRTLVTYNGEKPVMQNF